jgi:hypothetical protein
MAALVAVRTNELRDHGSISVDGSRAGRAQGQRLLALCAHRSDAHRPTDEAYCATGGQLALDLNLNFENGFYGADAKHRIPQIVESHAVS